MKTLRFMNYLDCFKVTVDAATKDKVSSDLINGITFMINKDDNFTIKKDSDETDCETPLGTPQVIFFKRLGDFCFSVCCQNSG